MKRQEAIKQTLEEIFSSADFQQRIKDKEASKELWLKVIDYAVIMEGYDENNFKEYINIDLRNREAIANFWLNCIAQKLNMRDLTTENIYKICKNIYENYIFDGYLIRVINSVEQQKINEIGKLESNSVVENKQSDEIQNILNIFKKRNKQAFPFGPHNEMDRAYGGWNYEFRGSNIPQYMAFPEWFAMLCGRSRDYFDYKIIDFNDEKRREAFLLKDYFLARSNIEKLMQLHHLTEAEANIVRGFFDEKWKGFKEATPVLSLIPKKYKNGPKPKEFLEVWDRMQNSKYADIINCILEKGDEGIGYETVAVDEMIFVDLTKAYPELKAKNLENEKER